MYSCTSKASALVPVTQVYLGEGAERGELADGCSKNKKKSDKKNQKNKKRRELADGEETQGDRDSIFKCIYGNSGNYTSHNPYDNCFMTFKVLYRIISNKRLISCGSNDTILSGSDFTRDIIDICYSYAVSIEDYMNKSYKMCLRTIVQRMKSRNSKQKKQCGNRGNTQRFSSQHRALVRSIEV